jgi:glutamyl-Q tRNA(Asp) synthetase
VFLSGVNLRLRVEKLFVEFEDRWQGQQKGCVAGDVGDFTVFRHDGSYSYNFVVVVDDFLQKISHVVRGMDILPLTLRQIMLQRELSYPSPVYGHVPLVMGNDGKKLSKSASSRALKESSALENLRTALKHLGFSSESYTADSCGALLRQGLQWWEQTMLS